MPRSVYAIALAALAAHLATLSRYGFYRDELYFIACFKRMAWGFVDQPPLVPLIAGLSPSVHGGLFATRVFAALAAALTILCAAAVARQLGAGTFGQIVTAIATALMPGSLFLGNTLTTTSFEPLTWTLSVLLVLLAARDRRMWIASALLIAIAAYMKYSIFLLCGAMLLGMLGFRRFRDAGLLTCATAGAIVLLLPNILWQAQHGFPMAVVLHGDVTGRHAFNAGAQYEFSGSLQNAPAFLAEQFAFAGPLSAPLWIAGVFALFRRWTRLNAAYLGAAYFIAVAVGLLTAAKGYYIIGIYPVLFSAGGVALERAGRPLRISYAAILTAAALLLAPLTIPMLSVNTLVAYMHAFGAPPKLVQPLFADEFGWRALTKTVAQQYTALPANERARIPVFADTYGVAAALEYYGPQYGLPQPISAQNQYYLWGTRGYDLSRMLAVGASEYWTLKKLYRNVRMVATFEDPYRWVVEGPTPIYLCTDPIVPVSEIWPALRWYGA